MTKRNLSQLIVISGFALLLQACSIPFLNTKKAETKLPDTFNNAPSETENTALINWKDFFEDSNLSELIDVAVVNNKEVNILAQRINMAKNEIQARKGEYQPFVNIDRKSVV